MFSFSEEMLTPNYFQGWFQQEIQHTSGSKKKCSDASLCTYISKGNSFLKEFGPQDQNVRSVLDQPHLNSANICLYLCHIKAFACCSSCQMPLN